MEEGIKDIFEGPTDETGVVTFVFVGVVIASIIQILSSAW